MVRYFSFIVSIQIQNRGMIFLSYTLLTSSCQIIFIYIWCIWDIYTCSYLCIRFITYVVCVPVGWIIPLPQGFYQKGLHRLQIGMIILTVDLSMPCVNFFTFVCTLPVMGESWFQFWQMIDYDILLALSRRHDKHDYIILKSFTSLYGLNWDCIMLPITLRLSVGKATTHPKLRLTLTN